MVITCVMLSGCSTDRLVFTELSQLDGCLVVVLNTHGKSVQNNCPSDEMIERIRLDASHYRFLTRAKVGSIQAHTPNPMKPLSNSLTGIGCWRRYTLFEALLLLSLFLRLLPLVRPSLRLGCIRVANGVTRSLERINNHSHKHVEHKEVRYHQENHKK